MSASILLLVTGPRSSVCLQAAIIRPYEIVKFSQIYIITNWRSAAIPVARSHFERGEHVETTVERVNEFEHRVPAKRRDMAKMPLLYPSANLNLSLRRCSIRKG